MGDFSKLLYGSDYDDKMKKFDEQLSKLQELSEYDLKTGYVLVPRDGGTIVFKPDDSEPKEKIDLIRGVFDSIWK